MNFRIKMIFYYVSAPHESANPDVIGDGCGCLALCMGAIAVHRTSHALLMDFLIRVETLLCQCELQEYLSLCFICVYHSDLFYLKYSALIIKTEVV